MKRLIPILMLLLCVGCTKRQDPEAPTAFEGTPVYVYSDAGTGCDYVSDGRGITPRMGADGKQVCKKEQP